LAVSPRSDDDVPGFGADRGLQTFAFVADVLAVLTYLGFEPKHVSPALPVFIFAGLATLAAAAIVIRQVRFALSFDASDFPPGYIRERVLRATGLFAIAASVAVIAGLRLN
jgi:hypothetical protein